MIQRQIGVYIQKIINKFPIISITGPRQSGKTTLARTLFPKYTYFNLENPDERMEVQEDILGFLNHYAKSGIIIDEAQNVPTLFSFLQAFVDKSNNMGKIILSGSQNFLLMEKISQTLAGRVGIVNLFPFSLSELRDTKYWKNDVYDFIFKGMYPALYDRDIEPGDYYPGYIQTYIERDVRSLKNIGNLNIFRRFLQLCAGRVGQILNYSSIANDLGIDHKTVKSWISVLEASFIIFLLNPHYENLNKRVIKQSKLYFYDTGLAASLLRIRSKEALYSFNLRGNLFENFIIAEYYKSTLHSGNQPDAFFYRDKTGNEVDLIIDKPPKLIPIEIKSGETIGSDFFKGLIKYQSLSGITPKECFLIYSGNKSGKRKHANILSWNHLEKINSLFLLMAIVFTEICNYHLNA
ncbi:MAG: AAA family ATPase [Spirochaetes bacterium]|nr:MAG: AAA family ATPase [Spirochaetota bacterium]